MVNNKLNRQKTGGRQLESLNDCSADEAIE